MKKLSLIPALFLTAAVIGCGNSGGANKTTNSAPSVVEQVTQGSTKMLFIYAQSGLNMRKTPSLEGEKLTKIPYGAAVEILEEKSAPVTMTYEGLKGKWVYVKYGADKGYVFEGFMGRLPVPQPGIGFADYFSKNFAPLKKTVTNSFQPAGEDDGYQLDVNFFYDKGIIIRKYAYFEGGDDTVTIPEMTVQEAFVFLKLFNLPALKTVTFPQKSYDKTFDDGSFCTVTVLKEKGEITAINIYVAIEFIQIKKMPGNKVSITVGSGA
ncbi:MAG: SH3 domain-containing protein [Brevinematales bacterium]|nr:SH3 domain-containing protein [Brevinematales bacterium]